MSVLAFATTTAFSSAYGHFSSSPRLLLLSLLLLLLLLHPEATLTLTSTTSYSDDLFADEALMQQVFSKYNIDFNLPLPVHASTTTSSSSLPGDKKNIFIFVHAAVGIFKKKKIKPGDTKGPRWGFGAEILLEMLEGVHSSGLGGKARAIFVTLLGSDDDRGLALTSLKELVARTGMAVHVLIQSRDIYLAEFPTLYALGKLAEAQSIREDSDALALYMHTKGVRNNGVAAEDWRRYMTYFLVEKHEFCMQILKTSAKNESDGKNGKKRRFETVGVLKNEHEYEGNFFWTRLEHVRRYNGNVTRSLAALPWIMRNRMRAEDFICGRWLYDWDRVVSRQEIDEEFAFWADHTQQHYCLHHTHHNMYDCPTPRSSYDSLDVFSTIRNDANCNKRVHAPWASKFVRVGNCLQEFGVIKDK